MTLGLPILRQTKDSTHAMDLKFGTQSRVIAPCNTAACFSANATSALIPARDLAKPPARSARRDHFWTPLARRVRQEPLHNAHYGHIFESLAWVELFSLADLLGDLSPFLKAASRLLSTDSAAEKPDHIRHDRAPSLWLSSSALDAATFMSSYTSWVSKASAIESAYSLRRRAGVGRSTLPL